MNYTVYKTTNTINDKIYIGMHKTKNPNDSYIGSGKALKNAVAKYGRDNFKKDILYNFDNPIDMKSKEAELVTIDFCLREDTYNLVSGGKGGFDYINRTGKNLRTGMIHSEESKTRMGHKGNNFRRGAKLSNETKQKIGANTKKCLTGSTKSDEHKRNISEGVKRRILERKLRL